jgi:hypothetical protein
MSASIFNDVADRQKCKASADKMSTPKVCKTFGMPISSVLSDGRYEVSCVYGVPFFLRRWSQRIISHITEEQMCSHSRLARSKKLQPNWQRFQRLFLRTSIYHLLIVESSFTRNQTNAQTFMTHCTCLKLPVTSLFGARTFQSN